MCELSPEIEEPDDDLSNSTQICADVGIDLTEAHKACDLGLDDDFLNDCIVDYCASGGDDFIQGCMHARAHPPSPLTLLLLAVRRCASSLMSRSSREAVALPGWWWAARSAHTKARCLRALAL